jgi:hypothetical protein
VAPKAMHYSDKIGRVDYGLIFTQEAELYIRFYESANEQHIDFSSDADTKHAIDVKGMFDQSSASGPSIYDFAASGLQLQSKVGSKSLKCRFNGTHAYGMCLWI